MPGQRLSGGEGAGQGEACPLGPVGDSAGLDPRFSSLTEPSLCLLQQLHECPAVPHTLMWGHSAGWPRKEHKCDLLALGVTCRAHSNEHLGYSKRPLDTGLQWQELPCEGTGLRAVGTNP